MNLLVTGSSGFVGSYAIPVFKNLYDNVTTLSLRNRSVDDVDITGIDTIVHMAGLAHQMTKVDPSLYYDINQTLTVNFAAKAKQQGVKHFIYLSTIKVYGDHSMDVVSEATLCNPTDDYGKSKWEAEKELNGLANENFKVSIIRPPLVYGKNVKGNLLSLSKLIKKIPVLPLGGIENKRSMVFVGNLVGMINTLIDTPHNGTFLAGDDKSISTSFLVDQMIKHLGLNKKNTTMPGPIIKMIKLVKPAIYQRLFTSFIVDNKVSFKKLNFTPEFTVEEGIKQMMT